MIYIEDIIKQYKCQKLKKELNISVNSATYNQVYEHFLSHNSSRKAEHNSREIAKLYFLLMLLIGSSLSGELNLLDKDISYDGLSYRTFTKLKKSLIEFIIELFMLLLGNMIHLLLNHHMNLLMKKLC